jgi:serine/threonine-protein kinase
MTETGLSLGTPHYMSPEQATAEKEITARSDQYALASVLYEMLTGSPPHVGSSAQQIIMKIITEPAADVTAFRKSVPAHVASAVATALEKLPADRFASTAAFARALHDGEATGRRTSPAAQGSSRGATTRPRTVVVLAAALVIATGAAVAGWARSPAPAPISRFVMTVDAETQPGVPIPSSDGARFVTTDLLDGILVRERAALESRRIGSEGWGPFFSPDGDEVALETGFPGALRVASLGSGAERTVVPDSVYGNGGSWSEDGWLYFVGGAMDAQQLRRVRPDGGSPEVIGGVDRTQGELFLYWPQVLPDGQHAIVTVVPTRGDAQVMSVDIATGHKTPITPGVRAVWSPSGHLLVLRADGTLSGATFDPVRAVLTSPLVPLLDGIAVLSDRPSFAVAGDGTLIYRTANPKQELVRVSRDGGVQPVAPDWQAWVRGAALSPDGSRLALSIESGGRFEIWMKSLPDGPTTRLSYDGIINYRPTWHDDGRSILFVSDRAGVPALYTIPADGSAAASLVRSDPNAIDQAEYSADGRWLVYRTGSGGARDVFIVGRGTDTTPIAVGATEFEEYAPTIAPDGRAVAYVSDESGRAEVYVRPLPEVRSARVRVSTNGGREPVWSHDGRELFYRDDAGDLVAARFAVAGDVRVVARETLFAATGYGTEPRDRAVMVAPDDASFYLFRSSGRGGPQTQVVVVQHWFRELEARVRAGR